MTALTITHQTSVTEDQIDHLGHMNVRFYGVAARAATEAVVDALGGDGSAAVALDVYTRFFREQLIGADLEVRSGVLDRGDTLRLYHELRNVDTDDLAASFVHTVTTTIDDAAATDAVAGLAEIPEAGRPRSVRLDADLMAAAPTLEEVRSMDLAIRAPRAVTAEECEPDGRYRATDVPMLVWGGEPLNGSTGPSLHDGPNGQKIGWAAMENRVVVGRLPEVGDRIQSFGAAIEIHDKATHRLMWAFDVERGDPLIAFEVVDLAFDTVQRRAVSIPDDLRAIAEGVRHPELAPWAGAAPR